VEVVVELRSLVAPPNVLLTAAHCESVFAAAGSVVEIGKHDLTDNSENSESFTVVEQVIHSFSWAGVSSFDYDYMMVKLSGSSSSSFDPVILDDGDSTVQLVATDFSTATVIGWGTSNVLLSADVNVNRNIRCSKKFPANDITDRMFCAAAPNNDSCHQRDSGGPIIDKTTEKQIGIVSWGYDCVKPRYPTRVYAKVRDQIDFITNQWILASWDVVAPPTVAPSPSCVDVPVWTGDSYEESCSWYNSEARCESWGHTIGTDSNGNSLNANEACWFLQCSHLCRLTWLN
jgi:trypsin